MNFIKNMVLLVTILFATNVMAAENSIRTGQFNDADSVHNGEGIATLVKDGDKTILKFENFYVTPGPDLYVWLAKNPTPKNAQDVTNDKNTQLAKLITPSGKQSYEIPADIDMSEFGSVVIWCKEFGVLFASAELK
ncbi:MAG: DM13 domain-containing protein [Hyphomicrobiales bacterium]